MRLLIITDAWVPQVNGVVRTLQSVIEQCRALGHTVEVIAPDSFRSIPCPTYPEIRLAVGAGRGVRKRIAEFAPNAVHIATEGPLGWAARRYCLRNAIPFTTSYHTRFPEYVSARFPVPESWGYAVMRWFHGPSKGMMVATDSLRRELTGKGFKNIRSWTRGVDTEQFNPDVPPALDLKAPVFAYVGRVSVEKNLQAFLDLDLPGTKLIVGDGPQREELEAAYPDVVFPGAKHGQDLAAHYTSADVFVFPSKTDTFGLVVLEALACGVPVAAYPVPGPKDVLTGSSAGFLDDDLRQAALDALNIPSGVARSHALAFSWKACAQQFIDNIRESLWREETPTPDAKPKRVPI